MALTQNDENQWSYTGDGATLIFQYNNIIFAATDLEVYLDSVLQVGGFSVSNVDVEAGGNVTFTGAPANGVVVLIVRKVPATQTVVYPESGSKFPAKVHEGALDKLTVLAQQILAEQKRQLGLGDTDPDTSIGAIAVAALRANGRLAFDALGLPIIVTADITGVAATAFGASLMDDANAAAGRTTLGLGTAATGDVGTDVQAFDADTLKADTTDELSVGFTTTEHDYGSIAAAGTLTVDLTQEALAKATIAGSMTLAPDASNNGTQSVLLTTNATGGFTITTSGWDKVIGVYTNTANLKHLFRVTQHDGFDVLEIVRIN